MWPILPTMPILPSLTLSIMIKTIMTIMIHGNDIVYYTECNEVHFVKPLVPRH